MSGERTAVVTGSTGGLGTEIVRLLAESGYDLVLVNRASDRAKTQRDQLEASFPSRRVLGIDADLMDVTTIHAAAERVKGECGSVKALYNVAGLLTDQRMTSAQGIEGHFAVNTLAPYVMAMALREPLSTGSSRGDLSVVVNFSSSAVKGVKALNAADLANPSDIGGLFGAYATTKFAVTAVSCMLADEFQKDGTIVVSADPGATRTAMTKGNLAMPWFLRLLAPLVFSSPEKQATKLVSGVEQARAAGSSGAFIASGKQAENPPLAMDANVQADLRSVLDRYAYTQA
ncbi:MAG: SDR family NAD(P)-dependent oxidoreductase [Planctomycetota bacterium]